MFSKTFAAGAVIAVSSLMALPAAAGTLTIDLTLLQQKVVEYHKPYVAGWLEDANGAQVGNLFVWYDIKKQNGGGLKYMKELRTWWRKGGRDLTLPIDGVTGATRAPGRQVVTLDSAQGDMKALKAGQYNLVIEATREQGGRDVVRLPLSYKPTAAASAAGKGDGELGDIKVSYKP